MRNLPDSQTFVREVERISNLEIVTIHSTEVLSRIAPNDGEFKFTNSFVIKTNELSDLIGLSILSWYLPEEIGLLLRWSLVEKLESDRIESRRTKRGISLGPLLSSKGQMLCYLLETSLWSDRDFFGNIYNEEIVQRLLRCFSPRFSTKRRVKRVQRHRGYRDKGTLRNEVHKNPNRFISDTLESRKIEQERISTTDTLQFLIGYIT